MITDKENYYYVRVEPMNHNGKMIDGKCRIVYIHKKYFDDLVNFIDMLHEKQCRDK
jgi:hypothetical protein